MVSETKVASAEKHNGGAHSNRFKGASLARDFQVRGFRTSQLEVSGTCLSADCVAAVCLTHMYEPFFLLISTVVGVMVPNVVLGNSRGTAIPGLQMPAVGLGTGAYSNNAAVGYNG